MLVSEKYLEFLEKFLKNSYRNLSLLETESTATQIPLNWSFFCKHSYEKTFFNFDTKGFFENDLKFSNNFETIIKVILNRRSHKIFISKYHFIVKFLKKLSNENKNFKVKEAIENILETSFEPNEVDYTLSLIAKLFTDNLYEEKYMKQFILQTGCFLPCFFIYCKKIDSSYIKCFNLWIERISFGKIYDNQPNSSRVNLDISKSEKTEDVESKFDIKRHYLPKISDLIRITKSRLFKIHSLRGFKNIVTILVKNNIPIPLVKLLETDNSKKYNSSLSIRNNNDSKKEYIDRILILLQELPNQPIPYKFLKRALDVNYLNLTVFILFRAKNINLLKNEFENLRQTAIRKKLASDEQLKHLIIMELKTLDLSKFYYKAYAFLLKRGVLEDLSLISPSPYGLAIASKLKKLVDYKSKAGDCTYKFVDLTINPNNKSNGLYFYKSMLRIDNIYKKYTFNCDMIVFKEYLHDMDVLNVGNHIKISICSKKLILKVKTESHEYLSSEYEITEILNLKSLMDNKTFSNSDQLKKETDETLPSRNENVSSLNDFGLFKEIVKIPSKINILSTYEENSYLLRIVIMKSSSSIIVGINDYLSGEMRMKECSFIEIDETFYGGLKNLFFSEINDKRIYLCDYGKYQDDFERESHLFFKKIIDPVGKILRYKNRKGVYIDNINPFYLSDINNFVRMKNVIEKK